MRNKRSDKKTPEQILSERKIGLPKLRTYLPLWLWAKLISIRDRVKFVYHFDRKTMKGKQVLLLCDHACRSIFFYTFAGYPFVRLNAVTERANGFRFPRFFLFLDGGCIPVKRFHSDLPALRNIFRVFSMGGSVLLFPEGIQSFDGTTMPVPKSTAGLIRMAGVTVVLCRSHGMFFGEPDFGKYRRRGHREMHYEILFTKEELKELSKEKIYGRLMDRFSYNEHRWNETAEYSYTSRRGLAEGLENLLYRCPVCGAEFHMKSDGDLFRCTACSNTVKMKPQYVFTPAEEKDRVIFPTIDRWCEEQREKVREEVSRPDFSVSYACRVYTINNKHLTGDPFLPLGEGSVTISREGIRYTGTLDGEKTDRVFDLKDIPLFARTKAIRANDFYDRGVRYYFSPTENENRTEKYRLIAEELNKS